MFIHHAVYIISEYLVQQQQGLWLSGLHSPPTLPNTHLVQIALDAIMYSAPDSCGCSAMRKAHPSLGVVTMQRKLQLNPESEVLRDGC
jgi:hypothetical protein